MVVGIQSWPSVGEAGRGAWEGGRRKAKPRISDVVSDASLIPITTSCSRISDLSVVHVFSKSTAGCVSLYSICDYDGCCTNVWECGCSVFKSISFDAWLVSL